MSEPGAVQEAQLPEPQPVAKMKARIQLLCGNGYVWDADVAHWLRLECGLIGASVGGVAAFKQQNAVHGLPVELSPEEVTLALERGWAELAPALGTAAAAAAACAAGAASRKRAREASPWQYYEDEDMGDYEAMDAADGSGQQEEEGAEPAWRAALADGAPFAIPTTPAEAAAANAGRGAGEAAAVPPQAEAAAAAAPLQAGGEEPGGQGQGAAAAADGSQEAPQWTFPATLGERHRYWVFRDLHAKGYRLTGGSKFGADFLVYPGDPTLYHAQFCVRLLPYRQPILPAMLAAATRGSHQARKHLLIASVVEEAAAAAGVGNGAPDGSAAASGSEQHCSQQQQGQEQQQEGEQQQPVQLPGSAGGMQLGADSRGTGSLGERFRIRYMTIGPVEGFG